MTDLSDTLTRVLRAYRNEIAEKRSAMPPYTEEEIERIDGWLAGVSYDDWFTLVAAFEYALDFAEEGWAYASDYFREKWGYAEEMERLRAILADSVAPDENLTSAAD